VATTWCPTVARTMAASFETRNRASARAPSGAVAKREIIAASTVSRGRMGRPVAETTGSGATA
jgi:hypothetical protein